MLLCIKKQSSHTMTNLELLLNRRRSTANLISNQSLASLVPQLCDSVLQLISLLHIQNKTLRKKHARLMGVIVIELTGCQRSNL
jgi:hypothetical protein